MAGGIDFEPVGPGGSALARKFRLQRQLWPPGQQRKHAHQQHEEGCQRASPWRAQSADSGPARTASTEAIVIGW